MGGSPLTNICIRWPEHVSAGDKFLIQRCVSFFDYSYDCDCDVTDSAASIDSVTDEVCIGEKAL